MLVRLKPDTTITCESGKAGHCDYVYRLLGPDKFIGFFYIVDRTGSKSTSGCSPCDSICRRTMT